MARIEDMKVRLEQRASIVEIVSAFGKYPDNIARKIKLLLRLSTEV